MKAPSPFITLAYVSLAFSQVFSQPPASPGPTPLAALSPPPSQFVAPSQEERTNAKTPYGRYHQAVAQIIGRNWSQAQRQHMGGIGEATILMTIEKSGKIFAVKVLSDSSLDNLGSFSAEVIENSILPPVPDNLAPFLNDAKMNLTFNFVIYDPPKSSKAPK